MGLFFVWFLFAIVYLSHPVADKAQLGRLFRATTIFTTVSYSILGITVGATFGPSVAQASNLNWHAYRGGTGVYDIATGVWTDVAWWAPWNSLYIVCFPAIDVVSAFPLNAITVGNNLFGAWFGKRIVEVEVRVPRR